MISEQQYEAAIKAQERAENVINQFHREKQERFDARIEAGEKFTDDELIYSAFTLCPCGHGIAYPKDCGPNHYWDCSAILKGVADKSVTHTDRLPFIFWEIKSEQQPSANGATTRGVFRPKPVNGN